MGPIATGDKVDAAGVLNRYRNAWPKLIGIEMESGGAATAAFQSALRPGFFMVRGVSDLADLDKDSSSIGRWRKYACAWRLATSLPYSPATARSPSIPTPPPPRRAPNRHQRFPSLFTRHGRATVAPARPEGREGAHKIDGLKEPGRSWRSSTRPPTASGSRR